MENASRALKKGPHVMPRSPMQQIHRDFGKVWCSAGLERSHGNELDGSILYKLRRSAKSSKTSAYI